MARRPINAGISIQAVERLTQRVDRKRRTLLRHEQRTSWIACRAQLQVRGYLLTKPIIHKDRPRVLALCLHGIEPDFALHGPIGITNVGDLRAATSPTRIPDQCVISTIMRLRVRYRLTGRVSRALRSSRAVSVFACAIAIAPKPNVFVASSVFSDVLSGQPERCRSDRQ